MTEVMVGGAILAGVGLSAAKIFKDQKNAQKRVEMDAKLNTFHSSLVKVMNDAKNCNATLSAYYNSSGASAWAAPTTIYRCSGAGCANTSVKWNANPTTMNTLRSSWLTNGSWIENTEANTDKGTRTWMVTSMAWAATPAASGKAVLKVNYQMNPDLPGGGRRVSKDINLNLRFTQAATPVFQECVSSNESSVINLQHDICASMSQVSSAGVIMQWNDVTQTCQALSGVKSCPAGTMLEGIRSDGTVHCKSISQGVNPNEDLMLQAACSAGTRVQLVIVDGKLTTRCAP